MIASSYAGNGMKPAQIDPKRASGYNRENFQFDKKQTLESSLSELLCRGVGEVRGLGFRFWG